MTATSKIRELLNSTTGIPPAFTKDSPVGTTVAGVITGLDTQQQTDMESGKPLTDRNGRPVEMIVITLATDLGDDLDDDGDRRLFVRGRMRRALAKAVGESGADELVIGGGIEVTYLGDGKPANADFAPPKLYKVIYHPPSSNATGAA